MIDVIVVGSGPGAVNAAAPLVSAGLQVVMLDFGNEDSHYRSLIPPKAFSEIRRTEPDQHRYFLGDHFEGIPFGAVRVGAQLTPPRQYILRDADKWTPTDSKNFSASTSLAKGGLGAGWSEGIFPFADDELRDMGIGLEEMQPHYDAVVARIGVCGPQDDLAPFFPSSPGLLPGLEPDSNAETIFSRYLRKRESLNKDGFFLGATRLSVCTREHRGRGPHEYFDMDYWADHARSAFRPQWIIEELQRSPNFKYVGRRFVHSFSESGGVVRVNATQVDTGSRELHEARSLVVAAGAIGTARLLLQSFQRYDTPVPILCNPYAYVPMLNWGLLGKEVRDRRHSMAQLTAMARCDSSSRRLVQAQVFSFRSLLTFKLMKESPFGYRQTLRLMRLMIPHFAILGIHHEDRPSPTKTCVLRRGAGGPDRLEITYEPSAAELENQHADERALIRYFRRLRCVPVKVVRPGHGANMHYGGTFPMQAAERELTCDPTGLLRGTKSVYVADGAVFPWLPAKGLTFTLMAIANRVGVLLARRIS